MKPEGPLGIEMLLTSLNPASVTFDPHGLNLKWLQLVAYHFRLKKEWGAFAPRN